MTKPFVLITGATGHIGFRTLVAALEAGYRVRVSSRKLAQAEALKQTKSVKPYAGDVECVEVPDMLAEGAFDQAVQSVEYILHMASPIPEAHLRGDLMANMVAPAIKGTMGMLESAAKSPSVKRIVITSSVVILSAKPGSSVISAADKAPIPSPDYVPPEEWSAYRMSKILAHEATDKWIESHKPSFDVVRILPSYVQGRNELVTRADRLGVGSNDVMIGLVEGMKATRSRPSNTVLVDDVAAVHVKALDNKIARSGDVFIASAGKGVEWNNVQKIAAKLFPDAARSGVLDLSGNQESTIINYDVSDTERVFGIHFAGFEEQVRSLVGQYIELKTGSA